MCIVRVKYSRRCYVVFMLFALRHNNSIKTTTIVEVCTGTGILMVM